jgi:hypothetical protein
LGFFHGGVWGRVIAGRFLNAGFELKTGIFDGFCGWLIKLEFPNCIKFKLILFAFKNPYSKILTAFLMIWPIV